AAPRAASRLSSGGLGWTLWARTERSVTSPWRSYVSTYAAPSKSLATSAISARFSLTCEVNHDPAVSSKVAAQEASIGSDAENEKRGVTAYRRRPLPCHRAASPRASS